VIQLHSFSDVHSLTGDAIKSVVQPLKAMSFATRVKAMIAKAAGLNQVPWDGYLKYYNPRPEYLQSRKLTYAKMLRQRFGLGPIVDVQVNVSEEAPSAAAGASTTPLPSKQPTTVLPKRSAYVKGGLTASNLQHRRSHSSGT
jgi:hypothetical protein